MIEPLTRVGIQRQCVRNRCAEVVGQPAMDKYDGDVLQLRRDVRNEFVVIVPDVIRRQIVHPRYLRFEDTLVVGNAYGNVLVVPLGESFHYCLLQ